jgi:V/A-type H+/Na+-transporting ATPase subunit C
MPGGGVSDYAAVHAVVRSKYSTLLTPQQYSEMVDAHDFPALLSLLKNTVYGQTLSRVDDKDLTPRRAIYQLWNQITEIYTAVIRIAPSYTRAVLTQLFRHFEVDNLKAVLRSIATGAPWDQVRFVLFPTGNMGVLPAQEMVDTGNISAAVELLRNTPYYATVSHAMGRYTAEKSLFPIEVALDLSYWRTLWDQVSQLPGRDHEQAVRIIGTLLDRNNFMWAIRYREYHHLSEEEIINYTLPFGYRVGDDEVRAIAAGAEIQHEVRKVFPRLPGLEQAFSDGHSNLFALEVALQRYVADQCRAAFAGYPFHIGIPLAFLVLKEMEIEDLTVLIEAKSSQVPAERFQSYLLVGQPPNR